MKNEIVRKLKQIKANIEKILDGRLSSVRLTEELSKLILHPGVEEIFNEITDAENNTRFKEFNLIYTIWSILQGPESRDLTRLNFPSNMHRLNNLVRLAAFNNDRRYIKQFLRSTLCDNRALFSLIQGFVDARNKSALAEVMVEASQLNLLDGETPETFPLLIAIKNEAVEIVQGLLSFGYDANTKSKAGKPCLHLAVEHMPRNKDKDSDNYNPGVVQALLDERADPTSRYKEITALDLMHQLYGKHSSLTAFFENYSYAFNFKENASKSQFKVYCG